MINEIRDMPLTEEMRDILKNNMHEQFANAPPKSSLLYCTQDIIPSLFGLRHTTTFVYERKKQMPDTQNEKLDTDTHNEKLENEDDETDEEYDDPTKNTYYIQTPVGRIYYNINELGDDEDEDEDEDNNILFQT